MCEWFFVIVINPLNLYLWMVKKGNVGKREKRVRGVKGMKKVIIVLAVGVVLLGVYYFWVDSLLLSPVLLEKTLTQNDLLEVESVKKEMARISLPGHLDYSPLYDLLEMNRGQIGKVFAICREGFDFIFCLKKASQQNIDQFWIHPAGILPCQSDDKSADQTRLTTWTRDIFP